MKIKSKHKRLIEERLRFLSNSYELNRINRFPKKIKFHIHFSDGFSNSVYYYKIKEHNSENYLYCKLSPIILEIYFNITFWNEGEKWMDRNKNY